MQPIVGTVAISEQSDTVAPVPLPSAYFGVAQGLMPGAIALAASPPQTAMASTFVCAHILECLLKAYLSKTRGSDDTLKDPSVRHDLLRLWSEAVADGLGVGAAPAWVQTLSSLHNRPFALRYSKGLHSLVLPAVEAMASDIAALLEKVRVRIL
jgi:hypothetical protein